MNASFGDLLATLLRNHNHTQEGLTAWLFENQHEPCRYRTASSIKEHLRNLRVHKAPAVDYPLLPDIALYFEEKKQPSIASRLRHIFLQQTFDLGNRTRLFEERPIASEGVEWMVFPAVDQSHFQDHFMRWCKQLRNGDKELLRESIEFYFRYAECFVHSLIRQTIAPELARASIFHGDYQQAYWVSESYIRSWDAMYQALTTKESDYAPLVQDLYNYLRMLQIRATAISFIFYHAPALASEFYFTTAWKKLRWAQPMFNKYPDSYVSLRIQFHTQRIRMLTRAMMGLSLSDTRHEEAMLRKEFGGAIRASIPKLEREIGMLSESGRNEYVDSFLVEDTLINAIAITTDSESEIASCIERIRELANIDLKFSSRTLGTSEALRSYRLAATNALCQISRYRVLHKVKVKTQRKLPDEDELGLKDAISDAIKGLTHSVDFAKQRHVRFTVDSLVVYAMYCQVPDAGVVVRDCAMGPILESIDALNEHPIFKKDDAMFKVNTDDFEHFECLLQANIFKQEAGKRALFARPGMP